MKLLFILLSFTSLKLGYSQTNIKVNEKAPKINITHWIENVPERKDLSEKYIVLEFWATWCGPCIAAVPHLNEIQNEFNQKDLYYISITDEPVELVQRILKRIPFNSMVVTDSTKETQVNFGDGVKGLTAYPLTILINKQGMIKWIGEPKDLNNELMKKFLSDQDLKINQGILQLGNTIEDEIKNEEINQFITLSRDKKINYYFNLKESKSKFPGSSTSGNVFDLTSYTLKDIYKKVFNISNIILPANLLDKKFDLLYKNTIGEVGLQRLEKELLEKLDLNKQLIFKKTSFHAVTVKDSSLLEKTTDINSSSRSSADDKILFTGYTINNTLDELSKISRAGFRFMEKNDSKYDFIINTKSNNDIIKSFKSYGLNLKDTTADLEFIILKNIK